MIINDEPEHLYDWDREFENIFGVDEVDPLNPLCKEPSEPSPDDDDPSEPTLLEEFDLDPDIYPRRKGSQEDVHEPGYKSCYVEDSSRCMGTAHDASKNQLSEPDTGTSTIELEKTMIVNEFIVAANDIRTFIGNLKDRLYGNTTSADVPKSYVRQDLQHFLPLGVSDYLVPIDVTSWGYFDYNTSIAMFADPFCSHALKMSVLYTAMQDRTILPTYASLLAEDIEKVWENLWAAQPPIKHKFKFQIF
ncbi:unnamed protein product [Orchesella dallaii]|uniref:Uncharacterized protein n=1 Tax=Orchesella dallaii TaxID=48710 RepID=A0ABP1RNW0_9HEXA